MPAYPWLETAMVDPESLAPKMNALRKVGVPYTDDDVKGAAEAVKGKSELEAVIAYLQGLGLLVK
jgi:cytochrome c oxidase cbb3-type subunit 2